MFALVIHNGIDLHFKKRKFDPTSLIDIESYMKEMKTRGIPTLTCPGLSSKQLNSFLGENDPDR